MKSRFLAPTICLILFCASAMQAQESSTKQVDEVKEAKLGETRNVHVCGDLYTSGQFTEDDIAKLKEAGIKRVISLRTDGEVDWSEAEKLEGAGLEFQAIPFRAPETLTDEVFDSVRKSLGEADGPVLMHCGSANRVGGVWLAYRVLDQGVPLEKALEEAKEIGLRNEGYEAKAKDYIRRKMDKQEASAMPGINRSFLDPELEVQSYVDRFEVESREVFSAREAVIEAIGVKSGDRVADVGAGTGIYSRRFARAVGANGWVYAVDIAAPFIKHINQSAKEQGLTNITGVLCLEDSITLPEESVDVIFVCDTYHHFEFPNSTLRSMMQALRPGGTLVVIDFERIEGQSREWLLTHVRAGKEVFQSEIEGAGFEFVEEMKIKGFEENYFLKFRRPE